MKNRLLTLAVPAFLVAAAASVHAVPTLTVESGGFSITKTDSNDINPLDGKIQINQAIGNFFINNVTAFPHPTLGSATSPDLNLLALEMSSSAGGQLTVTFTDDQYTGSPLDLMATINGNTALGATVQFLTYVNGTQLTDSGLLSGAPFSDVEYGSLSQNSAYSLTLKAIITHAPAASSQKSSLTARLQTSVPDGGASAMMLGLGLIGLGAFARRSAKN